MTDRPDAFISLTSIKTPGTADPRKALDEIRRIYFKTTKQTIENDLAHAIELLKSLDSEEQREKAAVFMEGIAQMRTEWSRDARKKKTQRGGGKKRT